MKKHILVSWSGTMKHIQLIIFRNSPFCYINGFKVFFYIFISMRFVLRIHVIKLLYASRLWNISIEWVELWKADSRWRALQRYTETVAWPFDLAKVISCFRGRWILLINPIRSGFFFNLKKLWKQPFFRILQSFS